MVVKMWRTSQTPVGAFFPLVQYFYIQRFGLRIKPRPKFRVCFRGRALRVRVRCLELAPKAGTKWMLKERKQLFS